MESIIESVMGRRESTENLGRPIDRDFECPNSYLSSLSHWLEWSPYKGFVHCDGCKKDYPTCLCTDDVDKATEIFLSTVEEVTDA